MEFRVLGPVEARSEAGSIALGRPKQRAVLAALLLRGGEAVPRDRLVDLIWGERPPGSAVASLQVYVHGLRQALGAERIETRGQAYRLRLDPGELDLQRFEQLVTRAERELAAGRPEGAAGLVRDALSLWRGPPLADLAGEPLADAEAGRLEELRLHALELRNEIELALGRHDALAPELEALVAEHPYRDRLRRQHVLALYRAGRQKEALEAYQAARHTLVDELGIEPSPELRELERAILRQDPALSAPDRPPGLETRLPVPPTPLVGRALEVAAVSALLRGQARLVTLTGPGGTGKTRLALAVAEELSGELPARFVDLSSLHDPELVAQSVGEALGLEGEGALAERLPREPVLLVLDNFEQLLPAAPVVAELLAGSPALRVVATSRAPLRLSAEHEYPVPPLPLHEAVELFTARARAVDPSFRPTNGRADSVAEICARLDGLPLALELAAARAKLLPPEAMVGRLERSLELLTAGARDLPARQRTLQATLDWSYELLDPGERELFARLAVFQGGCTVEAVEAIAGGSLDLLGSLVDESLLRRIDSPTGPRFAMLETIREYAANRLRESGAEEDARRRHAAYFLRVAEAAASSISSATDTEGALAELDAEHDNFRAALAWTASAGEVEGELRLAVALSWFWMMRGELTEARRRFEGVIERSASADPSLRASALVRAGIFPYRQGDAARARELWTEARELFLELGDEKEAARCLAELASVAIAEGDLDRAVQLYEQAAEQFRAQAQPTRLGIVLSNLGAVANMRAYFDAAARYQEEAIALQREIDDRDALSISLYNLARTEIKRGRRETARELLREALRLATDLGYKEVIAHCLQGAAELVAERDPEWAGRACGASLALFDEIGVSLAGDEAEDYRDLRGRLAGELGERRLNELLAEGGEASRDAIVAEALAR